MASSYNLYDYKRSRTNSPIDDMGILDLAYLDLTDAEQSLLIYLESSSSDNSSSSSPTKTLEIYLNNNLLKNVPSVIQCFAHIETLDLSSNSLKFISEDICRLTCLKNLIIKDNLLNDQSLPKEFNLLKLNLEVVNFSGNCLTQFPYQLLELNRAKEIYLGNNKIKTLPKHFTELESLEILYLGGNQIKCVPEEIAQLKSLTSLNLSGNQITNLPKQMAKLKMIRNLALHDNNLTTLPAELLKLNLKELSLRNNPLVNRFAKEFTYNVPSLLELSGRCIKTKRVSFHASHLPSDLVHYLESAQCCLNPKCKGVYFTSKVEHVKFVDFCGKYRVPLMQYLCSSSCNEKVVNKCVQSTSGSDSDEQIDRGFLKKILIG